MEPNSDSERLLGSGPRLQRQVKRMARSRSLQTASHLQTIHNEGGEIDAAMGLKLTRASFHWDIIRDLAKQARSKGYAAQAVDNAFFYTVTYSEKGSVYPWSERSQLPYASEISREIKNSFPLSSKLANDHICFRTSWDYFSGEVPAYVRPFFIYDLPIDLRLDIMWRRLSIVVYMNINQMVEALKGHGIEARVPANENELNRLFIPIVYSASVADNQTVEIRGSLAEFANKVGFEFMSLDGFVSCVSQTIAGMIEITKSRSAGAL